jgi:antitoxin component YwqK of YwqJK toxin-antitoxin module
MLHQVLQNDMFIGFMKSKKRLIAMMLMVALNVIAHAQTNVNQLDEKGKKNGLWKGYYPESKRLRYDGMFDHGKEVGTFKYYDDTQAQSLIATREFSKNDNSAYTIFYNQSKNIVSEGKVVNKLYEGQWKYYHENSKVIMTLEPYVKGKLDGTKSVFYPDAKIAEETNYSNGVKNGAYKKYTTDGVLLEESSYKNGQFDGKAIYRDPKGNIVAQGIYVNGKKKGIWQFYANGKLISEENMSKVKKLVKAKSK